MACGSLFTRLITRRVRVAINNSPEKDAELANRETLQNINTAKPRFI